VLAGPWGRRGRTRIARIKADGKDESLTEECARRGVPFA
jgi:hypothetical protein